MVHRRDLVLLLVAASLLLLPASAGAAPQWRPAETTEAAGSAVRVATDSGGNSVAVWEITGRVLASYRPHGGPWQAPEDLETDPLLLAADPLVVVQPNDQFVAAWVATSSGRGVLPGGFRWSRRPAGEGWSGPGDISQAATCCLDLLALEAGDQDDVTALWNEGDGFAPFTSTKPRGSETWEAPDFVAGTTSPLTLAVGSDGSSQVAWRDVCNDVSFFDCVRTAHHAAGGDWVAENFTPGAGGNVTGIALAGRPGGRFALAWGEDAPGSIGRTQNPDGVVSSADRDAGGAWGSQQTIAAPVNQAPGCASSTVGCIDLAARGDTLAAVWQQGNGLGVIGEIAASLRTGDGAWGAPETVGDPDEGDADPRIALTAAGRPVAAWLAGPGRTGAVVRGAHRNGSDDWTQVDLGTPSAGEGSLEMGGLAADGQGDALAGWRDPDGGRTAGFDAAGPRFTAFGLPSGGAGEALAFSAAAADNWAEPTSIAWQFGDGTGAAGGVVSHAYGAAGEYAVTATATDAAGNAGARSGTVPVAPAQAPPPPPPGCGSTDTDSDGIFDACDDSNGAERPVPFRTVNATVVSGDVFVKLPAGAARAAQARPPRGFVRLEGAETIPVGSTLDTRRGRVRIRSAANTRRRLQSGEFFRGRFRIRQVRIRRRSRTLITDMRLTGSSFRRACRSRVATVSQRRRSRRRVRRLFGNAKGSFRTSGRNAAATVRGTRWSVQDRCDGTLVTVQQGRVAVRDFTERETIVVRAPARYLARRR